MVKRKHVKAKRKRRFKLFEILGFIAFRLKHMLKLATPNLPKKDFLYELCENVERLTKI
ncbi:MAG: hypothetical protein QW589_01300 [Candidatus Bathyarchaeia archaeon]